jgi:hypothetical protein
MAGKLVFFRGYFGAVLMGGRKIKVGVSGKMGDNFNIAKEGHKFSRQGEYQDFIGQLSEWFLKGRIFDMSRCFSIFLVYIRLYFKSLYK